MSNWEERFRSGDMPGAIREYVRDYDHVTFVELVRKFEDVREGSAKGELSLTLSIPERGTVTIWPGVCEEFGDAIDEVTGDGSIVSVPGHYLSYMIDGGMPKMPMVEKMPPKGGYKEDRWLPVVLRTKEAEQLANR